MDSGRDRYDSVYMCMCSATNAGAAVDRLNIKNGGRTSVHYSPETPDVRGLSVVPSLYGRTTPLPPCYASVRAGCMLVLVDTRMERVAGEYGFRAPLRVVVMVASTFSISPLTATCMAAGWCSLFFRLI